MKYNCLFICCTIVLCVFFGSIFGHCQLTNARITKAAISGVDPVKMKIAFDGNVRSEERLLYDLGKDCNNDRKK